MLAFDAVQLRGVFGIGIGLRVIFLDGQFAFGILLVLGEEILDALGVSFEEDGLGSGMLGLGAIKTNLNRCIQLLEDRLGPLRERVGFFFGEIQARFDCASNHIEGDYHDRHHQHANGGIENGLNWLLHFLRKNLNLNPNPILTHVIRPDVPLISRWWQTVRTQ